MNFFSQTFTELPDYSRILNALAEGETPVCVTGLSGVHKSQLALTLAGENTPAMLLVTGTEAEAVRLCADINAMADEETAMYFPARELLFTSAESRSYEFEHERIRVLTAVQEHKVRIVAAGIEALLQPTIPPETLRLSHITLAPGDSVDLEQLRQQDDLCAVRGRLTDQTLGGCHAFRRIGAALHLHGSSGHKSAHWFALLF